jgi:CyaY protein
MSADTLTDAQYRQLAHDTLASVEAQVDAWLESDEIDIDSHRTGGLLELAFPNGSKIILNTQPPLQELWMAARAGGFHFKHLSGRWLDTKDSEEFFTRLSRLASEQAGRPLRFNAPD